MLNKKSTKIVTTALVLSMTLLAVSPESLLAKKTVAKLSKTALTLKKGKTATLKVKKAGTKVKWSIGKGKAVIKLSNKKKASVTIKAVKEGKATVVAKAGKKKLTCKVTVKGNTKQSGTQAKNTVATEAPVASKTPVESGKPSALPTVSGAPVASAASESFAPNSSALTPVTSDAATSAPVSSDSPSIPTSATQETVSPVASEAVPVASEVAPVTTEAAPVATEATQTESAVVAPSEAPTEAPVESMDPKIFKYEGLNNDWIKENIDPSKPVVAFTFDDGPVGNKETDSSIIIQDALIKHKAHATFFYIGSLIDGKDAAKAEIKRAFDNGFELGNHSYDWSALNNRKEKAIKESIDKTNALLTEISGYSNFLFRAPNLSTSKTMFETIQAPFIACALDSHDWEKIEGEKIYDNVTKGIKDGQIILMHENGTNTYQVIDRLLDYCDENGIQVVSVSELFAIKGVQLEKGKSYNQAK